MGSIIEGVEFGRAIVYNVPLIFFICFLPWKVCIYITNISVFIRVRNCVEVTKMNEIWSFSFFELLSLVEEN